MNTFSSRWPWLPAKLMVVLLPITCAATMVTASHWVGFTLPGMIEEPGSFSGSDQLAEPGARARAQQPDVAGDLEQRHRHGVEGAMGEHEGVVAWPAPRTCSRR